MKKRVTASLEVETELKTNGLRLSVYNDDNFLGYFDVGKARLDWTDKNGKKLDGRCTWEEFVAWIKSEHPHT
jgi:hypothetical protein